MVEEKACAKVNLALDVKGRRENGYHEVSMIMQSIDLYDTLSFEKEGEGISLSCDNAELNKEAESGKDNLIVRASKAFFEYTGIKEGVKITLTKRIPIAAGMAGGSTDAAATLRGLNTLFSAGLKREELEKIGVKLGADIPFCITGGTKLSEGIGEILTDLPSPKRTALVICKPDINVSTKDVYEAFDGLTNPDHPKVSEMKEALINGEYERIPKLMGNSLEGVTGKLHPIIGEIEKIMVENGAIKAMMSGSGPTVFAIVPENKQALIVEKLKSLYPLFYVKGHFYG